MKLNPNCSESVFKFYTTNPKEIQKILQLIANEIAANYGDHPKDVPLFETVKEYEDFVLEASAGLGDPVSKTTIVGDGLILNIGNNDISDDKTGWVDAIKSMGIWVEEAEYSKELKNKARDCTCGVTYFDGYNKLITDENRKFTVVRKHPRRTKRKVTRVKRHRRRLK